MTYEEMVIEQKGHCKICQKASRLVKDLGQDGNVLVGLLCIDCEEGICRLKRSQGLLFAAVKYLQESKKIDRNHQYFIK